MTEEAQQIALVTGGGQGIGAGISLELARAGYYVVVNDLDESRGTAMVAEIASAGGRASYALADVSDSSSVDAMFDRVEAEHGAVSVLVNNAGVNGNAGIRNVTDAFWDRVTSIDLDGVLHCTRRALGPMREAGAGSVINIASRAWLGWWAERIRGCQGGRCRDDARARRRDGVQGRAAQRGGAGPHRFAHAAGSRR